MKINPQDAGDLAVRWTFTTHGDVSAIPAVVGGYVYFPDWGGYLTKLDATTGAVVWSHSMSSYDGIVGSVSRTAPAVAGNTVYVGDQNGAHLLAIDARTGELLWASQMDSHPAAILTSGPLVYSGVVYQGVSSAEESFAADGSYRCCTFRGSTVAVNAATGAKLWQTYMVPSNGGVPCSSQKPVSGCGYSGGAIWSTTPAIDPASKTLFVSTGNNYTVPDSVTTCEAKGGRADQCLDPEDHVDAIVALNASTGRVKWATGTGRFDDWNGGCARSAGSANNCPSDPGPDYDFGSGPQLFTVTNRAGKRQLEVGAGEKSGQYWALDALTGKILWSQAAGPGSSSGGIQWGSATDGRYIYVAEANVGGIPYQLPSGETITSGSWAAINAATGKIVWETPDPSHNAVGGGNALGPVSVAGGVLFAPSMSGKVYALDADNGHILWTYPTHGSVVGGASVVNGNVYWGDGYSRVGGLGWTGSTTFYDFAIDATLPSDSKLPSITGSSIVGHTVSASTGTWSGTPKISYSYQWQRCHPRCANISGARRSSYKLIAADTHAKLQVVVTATNLVGAHKAVSRQVGPVLTAGQIQARLTTLLLPRGNAARIRALLKDGGYTFSFSSPGPGHLVISWHLASSGASLVMDKPLRLATISASLKDTRPRKIKIGLTPQGKRALNAAKHLTLTARAILSLSGGPPITATRSFTLSR